MSKTKEELIQEKQKALEENKKLKKQLEEIKRSKRK